MKARTKLCIGAAWMLVIEECKQTYGWTCHICGQSIPVVAKTPHPLSFEVDHIHPTQTFPHLAMALSNLRPAHRRCNRARGQWDLTPRLMADIAAQFKAS